MKVRKLLVWSLAMFGCVAAYAADEPVAVEPELQEAEEPAAEPVPGDAVEPEGSEYTHVHAFPVVQYKHDGDRKKVKVGNAIVAEGFSRSERGDESKTAVLDVPFASLAKVKRDGDRKEMKLVNAPFSSLVRTKSDEDSRSVKVLKVPFFTLAHTESSDDGQFDNRFVKLPIVGSLFRHKRTKDKEQIRFLFFRHTKRLKSKDDDEGRKGKGSQRHTNVESSS